MSLLQRVLTRAVIFAPQAVVLVGLESGPRRGRRMRPIPLAGTASAVLARRVEVGLSPTYMESGTNLQSVLKPGTTKEASARVPRRYGRDSNIHPMHEMAKTTA